MVGYGVGKATGWVWVFFFFSLSLLFHSFYLVLDLEADGGVTSTQRTLSSQGLWNRAFVP